MGLANAKASAINITKLLQVGSNSIVAIACHF